MINSSLRIALRGLSSMVWESTFESVASKKAPNAQSLLLSRRHSLPSLQLHSSATSMMRVGGVRMSTFSADRGGPPLTSSTSSSASPVFPTYVPSSPQRKSGSGDVSPEIHEDMEDLFVEIRKELQGRDPELCKVAEYYFDGQGKAIRPMIAIIMARAINAHLQGSSQSFLLPQQKKLALVTEMIHTATLVHDDVIDRSNKRRGKPSVNALFGERRTIVGGDYVLAKAGAMVARLNSDEVTEILAQVLEDLVHGEFMQMDSSGDNSERFAHYIGKTFNKTASLMAYSCKGVAILGGSDDSLAEKAFQYGKHLGIAFQLVDDLLDFVSSTAEMGKPVAADLQLGLATAPVLFAAQKFPELNPLIERRFSEPDDVAKALELVKKSDGLEETKILAQRYCSEAVRYANFLKPSVYRDDLVLLTEKVVNRTK
ncbi:unnamed protein product [Orchesella dallaii]|uniref:Decaprenyl-diphosphate synthase subunit 1 n=1 Tax=Orchesella dallaii TaxID=48710 RepID=A0ABP1PPN0_9HEXA